MSPTSKKIGKKDSKIVENLERKNVGFLKKVFEGASHPTVPQVRINIAKINPFAVKD